MRKMLLSFIAATSLVSCGATPPSPDASAGGGAPLAVYRRIGSVQCSGGGTPPAAMRSQLASAGVQVLKMSCGNDGRMYAAVCGGPDGAIAVFEIPSSQLNAASALGFAPLSTLPSAASAPCR